MPIDIYEQHLCEPLFHREKQQPFTKARQAEVQASYYQRRGWFQNKKRMLFKRIGLDAKQFAPIESMEELETKFDEMLNKLDIIETKMGTKSQTNLDTIIETKPLRFKPIVFA